MKQEHIDLCKNYHRARKLYDKYFEDILQWIIKNPKAKNGELNGYWKISTGKETTDMTYRIFADARTVIVKRDMPPSGGLDTCDYIILKRWIYNGHSNN